MKVLVLGWVWPEPKSSAAGSRILQLLEVFHDLGMEVHFACAAHKTEYAHEWEFPVKEHHIQINHSGFDSWIKNLQPDIVLFDRLNCEEYFAWRVAKHCPKALRVLDCEDLISLRIARQNALATQQNFNIKDIIQEPMALREIASIKRSHLNIIISTVEIDILQNIFEIPKEQLHHTPLLADKSFTSKPFEEREGMVSIGNFKHPPNLDACKYLKKEIWPIIRTLKPDAQLYIYGAYPSPAVFQMNDPKNGFHIKGRAEDALEVISNAKVLIAPLRFGAGQKGKLLDAMMTGTPSVTTSIGAEAMDWEEEWNGFVCDSPQAFAEKAVELINNEETWASAQAKTQLILEHNFNKAVHQLALKERLLQLLEQKEAEFSFENQLLNFHSFKHAEYMSKWIEEKESHQTN